jgi:hypothetical protein
MRTYPHLLITLLSATLLIAACSVSGSEREIEDHRLTQEKQPPVSLDEGADTGYPFDQLSEPPRLTDYDQWPERAMLQDNQGAVVVTVTPLNLNYFESSIEFEVSLDTHSIDLSMNLAELATLVTDTGFEIQATSWDGAIGGHHVRGILSFPSILDGNYLLEDASRINLVVADLDASERIFIWER